MPTLAVAGGKSPDWMHHAMSELAGVLPNAKHRTLQGQTYIVKPEVLTPVLVEFFEGSHEAWTAKAHERKAT